MQRLKILIVILLPLVFSCRKEIGSVKLVILPDIQTYAEKYPEILAAQRAWVAKNADSIDFVIQVGDITQNHDQKEWEAENTISVQTYSPWLKEYKRGTEHQFVFREVNLNL